MAHTPSPPQKDKPHFRSLVGMAALLLGLALYGLIVAEASARIGDLPFIVEVIFYIVAGLAWLWPARALVRWMLAPGAKSSSHEAP